ncbi:MAG: DUF4126 domain-containing protein [Solirubrobacteraceae bacterium]
MNLFLDICQGLGLGAAAGIRPFLPAVLAGLLTMGDLGLDFDGTPFSFLESPVWLVALAVVMVLTFVLSRGENAGGDGFIDAAVGGLAMGIAALLFAGSLADHGRDSAGWIVVAVVAGIAVAALGNAAVRDLAARTAERLDAAARRALPLWFEGVALVLAALSIVVPPVALVVLPFLVWLLLGGRKREGGKYAGLRVLR